MVCPVRTPTRLSADRLAITGALTPSLIGTTVPQDLVRDWKNTVHAELSVRGQVTKKLLLSGTLGYQSGASPDSRWPLGNPQLW